MRSSGGAEARSPMLARLAAGPAGPPRVQPEHPHTSRWDTPHTRPIKIPAFRGAVNGQPQTITPTGLVALRLSGGPCRARARPHGGPLRRARTHRDLVLPRARVVRHARDPRASPTRPVAESRRGSALAIDIGSDRERRLHRVPSMDPPEQALISPVTAPRGGDFKPATTGTTFSWPLTNTHLPSLPFPPLRNARAGWLAPPDPDDDARSTGRAHDSRGGHLAGPMSYSAAGREHGVR